MSQDCRNTALSISWRGPSCLACVVTPEPLSLAGDEHDYEREHDRDRTRLRPGPREGSTALLPPCRCPSCRLPGVAAAEAVRRPPTSRTNKRHRPRRASRTLRACGGAAGGGVHRVAIESVGLLEAWCTARRRMRCHRGKYCRGGGGVRPVAEADATGEGRPAPAGGIERINAVTGPSGDAAAARPGQRPLASRSACWPTA